MSVQMSDRLPAHEQLFVVSCHNRKIVKNRTHTTLWDAAHGQLFVVATAQPAADLPHSIMSFINGFFQCELLITRGGEETYIITDKSYRHRVAPCLAIEFPFRQFWNCDNSLL